MILRLWRGWTNPENADRYEELIRTTIFPGILARSIAGLEGLELFRHPLEAEVEFMTLMRFASRVAVELSPVRTGSVGRAAGRARDPVPVRRKGDALREARPARREALTPPVVSERHSETS